MIKVPDALWRKFERYLAAADVPRREHGNYRKWLRLYLDFCSKYRYEYANADSIPPFLEKLASKRQDSAGRECIWRFPDVPPSRHEIELSPAHLAEAHDDPTGLLDWPCVKWMRSRIYPK